MCRSVPHSDHKRLSIATPTGKVIRPSKYSPHKPARNVLSNVCSIAPASLFTQNHTTTRMRIRVSIVEDSRGTRESLAELLSRAPGLTCVGSHANGELALKAIPGEKPDVVLMDINLPGMSGIDCVAQLKEQLPKT